MGRQRQRQGGSLSTPVGSEDQGKGERTNILMGYGTKQRGNVEVSQELSSTLFELFLMIISPFHTRWHQYCFTTH